MVVKPTPNSKFWSGLEIQFHAVDERLIVQCLRPLPDQASVHAIGEPMTRKPTKEELTFYGSEQTQESTEAEMVLRGRFGTS